LAGHLQQQHPYKAAPNAAPAAARQGGDARALPDKGVPAPPPPALTRLRADLPRHHTGAKGEDPTHKAGVRQRLAHWQQDAALASVRGAAIDRLPEDDRAAWRRLWDDVESLRKEASAEPVTSELRSGSAARE